MTDYLKRNWQYLCGAALIHVLFAGVFGLTMINMQRHELKPVLAIQATLVDASKLNQVPRPKRVEPEKPPVDTSAQEEAERQKEEAAKRLKEQQEAQEREAQTKQREEQQRETEAKEQQVREQREVERKRLEADAKTKAEADAKTKADAKAKADTDAKAKVEADRKRVADIERKQKEEADRRKAAEDAQSKAAREAELKRQLAEEEGVQEAVSAGLQNQYIAMISQHVERQWNRPASAGSDVQCTVKVAQTPTGVVLSAQVTECNGDAVVKQSIESAVLKASPLPLPPDPRVFQRNLIFKFKPAD